MEKKMMMNEDGLRSLVKEGVLATLSVIKESRVDGSTTMPVDMGEAFYEYEKRNPGFDALEEWIDNLPHEVKAEVSYAVSGGDPGDYYTPGTGTEWDPVSFEVQDPEIDVESLTDEQIDILNDAIDTYIQNNFQGFMEDECERRR